ncbi:metastasis suppressor protein 1 [Cynoglossus semilaevis]|uniref:metastasis suppressor protein 1 n=1 Tax=Cynoglossus semilaevis TaxID=244447 RepID=UPI000496AEAB|nr:metastasis suppressor protein 1 [Cynoglossus semilaevis]
METAMERECSGLGGLFQSIIADMKGSYPVWDDFISKASKLQSQLRTTVVMVTAFLDSFQKVADLATNSRGGTRDIGSALTRMCVRQRSIENKLRQFSLLFLDCLINPLQEQMEEWKRTANSLDKDHAKEYKKARQEIKKRSSDTLKLQKKAKKADVYGRGDLQPQLDSALQDVTDKYLLLEETEKTAVRKALVEERSRFCCLVSMLRPVVGEEVSMLAEVTHLKTLTEDLKLLTMDPHKLPPSSEQVIVDLKGSDCTWSYQTPPSSPSTQSRKSSMCSSLNSVNSSDSRSSGSHSHSPTSHFRYRTSSSSSSSLLPLQTPARLSSISSHDSGFISQDAFHSKSPSPMPLETCQDWAKPGPYEQPVVNTLRRSRTLDPSIYRGVGEEPQRVKGGQKLEDREVHEELARVLARGLHLDLQGSSRDSLQGSSGYSSQTNTPCCSEDANVSHVSDCDYYSVGVVDQDSEQQQSSSPSPLPRNSHINQTNRRMFQSKRPCSTPGPTSSPTPGVATIRRTPSSKPNLRRPSAGLGLGPIPIRPPMIPVKTPTVPEHLGLPNRTWSENTPPSPLTTPLSPGSNAYHKQNFVETSSDPPTPPPQPGARVSDWDRRPLPELLEEAEVSEVEDYLVAIRRGVILRKTITKDRSAPNILREQSDC